MNEVIEQEDMQRAMLKHESLSKDHSENASKKRNKYIF